MNTIGSLRQWTVENIRSPLASGIRQTSDLVLVKRSRLTLHSVICGRKKDGVREATPEEVKRMPVHMREHYQRSHLKPWGVYMCYWKASDFFYVYLNNDGSFTLIDGENTCAQLCKIPVFTIKEFLHPVLDEYAAKTVYCTKA